VHAFFIEAFRTAVLTFVVFTLTHHKNPIPGPAIPAIVGAVYGVLVATLGPLTGYV
jgi:glycerol uptake facilitator-like aquaporin